MNYVHSLLNNGSALAFEMVAHPPTVTLPRIKVISQANKQTNKQTKEQTLNRL
jgi:hypothetical protein